MKKLKNSELNRLVIKEFKAAEKMPLIVVLDNILSLNNLAPNLGQIILFD